jgi:GTP-binding protein
MLNFYRVNDRFFLVDLPGFGFARAPGPVREGWKKLVEWYLARPEGIHGVVHLVDGRHPPFPPDQEMMEYLAELGVPALVVLTKIDKVPKGKRKKTMDRAAEDLGLEPEQLLPFSSKTREGRDALLAALDELLPPGGS